MITLPLAPATFAPAGVHAESKSARVAVWADEGTAGSGGRRAIGHEPLDRVASRVPVDQVKPDEPS